MNDEASDDAAIQIDTLNTVGDALSAAFIVYDKNDLLIFASRQVLGYFPVNSQFVEPGTRLRDFLGALYDSGIRFRYATRDRSNLCREDWIAERIASHWRERSDQTERHGPDRWTRIVKRRLPSGYGVCLFVDVSEQKKREEQWRADLERVQLTEEILDTLPFPVFVKDRNLTYVAANKAYCTLRGMGVEQLIGRTVYDILVPEAAVHFDRADRHVMETGMPAMIAEVLVRSDGAEMSVITRKQRIGKPGRYFLVTSVEDISELALAGASGGVKVEGDPSNTVTSLSPVDFPPSAQVEIVSPEQFTGRKVLLVTADTLVESAAMRTLGRFGIEACTVHGEDEQAAFLDMARSVGLAVDLVVIDTQMDFRSLEIAREHGIDVLTLDGFQLTTQLAYLIARHFNRRRDAPSLPAPPTDDWSIATEAPPESQVDVLVAEDNDVNRIVFSQILEGLRLSYVLAADGNDAVDLWERHRPAIVLMDTTLPVLNGYEATQKIREREAGQSYRTPIIGVLPQAFDRDHKACLDAGMDDVILKPISPDGLIAVFETYRSPKPSIAAG
ncbi:response regulator [Rhizobium sp. LjRoot30]|uniref:response regulator n=1 Tax=Rhizobium sp. LjRoot30 TaxID=3342320 RepID=UPI003ECD4B50